MTEDRGAEGGRREPSPEEAEDRLRAALIDNASEIGAVLDAEGAVRYVGPSLEGILGRYPDAQKGRAATDCVHPEDAEAVRSAFAAALSGRGLRRPVGFRMRHTDGSWRHFEAAADNLLDDPDVEGVVVNAWDVTERKEAEEALKEERNLLRTVIDNVPGLVFAKDAEHRFVVNNEEHLWILGAEDQDEALGSTDEEFMPEELTEGYHADDRRVFRTGEIQAGKEEPVDVPSGERRWISTTKVPLRNEEGEIEGLVAISQDVTERKKAEDALKKSEERYRSLVELSPEAIAVHDGRKLLFVNPAGARLLGAAAPGDIVGRPVLGFVHPDDREIVASRIRGVLEERRRTPLLEERYLRLDGSVVEMEVAGQHTTFAGKPAVQVVLRDISERKRAEEALRRSEERYRTILEQMEDGYFEVDLAGNLTFFNDSVSRMLGYPREELTGMNNRGFMGQESAEKVYRHFNRVYRTGEPLKGFDWELTKKDGGRLTVETSVSLVRGSTGDPIGFRGVIRDVTERREAEQVLRKSEERFRALVQNVSDVVTVLGADGAVRYASPASERVLGYGPEERIGQRPAYNIHPEDLERVRGAFAAASGGATPVVEYRYRRKDGSWVHLESVIDNLLSDPSVGGIVINSRDVTERKEAEEALERVVRQNELILNSAGEGICGLDAQGIITFVNPAASRMLGYEPDELVGRPMHETVHHSYPDGTRYPSEDCPIRAAFGDGEVHRSSDEVFWRRDGTAVPVEYTSNPIRENGDLLVGAVVAFRDVTERKVLERRLEYQALHDPLTGLPNRTLFMDRLGHTLSRAERSQECIAVLFMDLDDFKDVNDSLGHEAGDGLLVRVAERLRGALRPGDTAARLGGDEFVILLEGLADEDEATGVAERIKEALREPFALGEAGREAFVATSIGISFNGSGRKGKPGDLLREADVAMYAAKRGGKARHEAFDGAMDARVLGRFEALADLRRALERGEFAVRYQPKVDLKGGGIVCAEALVHWEHPRRGLLSPRDFVPLAEETGLIVPLGLWVLEEACRRTEEWQAFCPKQPPLTVSVNLSARQFREEGLAQDVARTLEETGLDAGCLILEITESAVMEDAPLAARIMRELKELGAKLSIDDFGTGYSSLSYLNRFPVDYLKIDRSFVKGLGRGFGEDGGQAMVASGIIGLAHAMGLEVVAEGVETEGQLAKLKEMGCDMVQGYYFSGPLPSAEAAELLASGPRWGRAR